MGIFGKKYSPELDSLIDSLARSYIRGVAGDRNEIVNQISAAATQLKRNGLDKAVANAKSYRPAFFPALPAPIQQEFARYLNKALG